jgi:hypothetical protein
MVWTGLIWLTVGTSGGLLWTRWWTFGFHKIVFAVPAVAIKRGLVVQLLMEGLPCGGGLEYLHHSPGSHRKRRNWIPVPGGITGPTCAVLLLGLGGFFLFLIHTHSVELLGWGISPSQGRCLHTEQHESRINANRYPWLEWASNE